MQERLVLLWGKHVVNVERQIILPEYASPGSKGIHEVSETSLQTGYSLFVKTISGDIRSSNQVFVDIEVGQYNEAVSFKLDTGV